MKLPNIADQQRELLVRRLAAEDDSIDLASLDVIWTAEFARGRVDPALGGRAPRGRHRGQARGPGRDRRLPGQGLGDPAHEQHAAALVPQGPRGRAARRLHLGRDDRRRGRQGDRGRGPERPVRGLVVWINALIASAGGQIVNEEGEVLVNDTAKTAAEIEKQARHLARSAAGHVHRQRGRGSASASRTAAPTTWSTTRTSTRRAAEVSEEFQKNIGWARLPAQRQGQAERAAARRLQHRRIRVLEQPGPRLRGGRVPRQPGEPGPQRRAGRPAADQRVGLRRSEGAEGVPLRR